MTKEEFASKLNGREYGEEITREEEAQAKASGLVVIFGASDDLMEFRGAIDDEIGAYEGTTAFIAPGGLLQNSSCDACQYFQKARDEAVKVEAIWDKDGYSWIYKTDIPHATFDILEGDEKYCRGIVLELPK